MTGSAGLAPGRTIPGLGVSAEAARDLAEPGARVHLLVDAVPEPAAVTETLILDLPGRGPDRVVVSAHIDGHNLAESASDNATGVAAALALARAAAPAMATMALGPTVCLFSAEEWALTGSRIWLIALPDRTGASRLRPQSRSDCRRSRADGFDLRLFRARTVRAGGRQPPQACRSRARAADAELRSREFAVHGVPSLRLLAGLDRPESNLRHLLTGADTPRLTQARELQAATRTAGAILWRALSVPDEDLRRLRA